MKIDSRLHRIASTVTADLVEQPIGVIGELERELLDADYRLWLAHHVGQEVTVSGSPLDHPFEGKIVAYRSENLTQIDIALSSATVEALHLDQTKQWLADVMIGFEDEAPTLDHLWLNRVETKVGAVWDRRAALSRLGLQHQA